MQRLLTIIRWSLACIGGVLIATAFVLGIITLVKAEGRESVGSALFNAAGVADSGPIATRDTEFISVSLAVSLETPSTHKPPGSDYDEPLFSIPLRLVIVNEQGDVIHMLTSPIEESKGVKWGGGRSKMNRTWIVRFTQELGSYDVEAASEVTIRVETGQDTQFKAKLTRAEIHIYRGTEPHPAYLIATVVCGCFGVGALMGWVVMVWVERFRRYLGASKGQKRG